MISLRQGTERGEFREKEALKQRGIIRSNGPYLEIEDQYLQFFEQVLEVNEEINISFINENIEQIKQNINYYLKENNESRRFTYLRAVKSSLRKTGRVTFRNIVDLSRNIENTFKTEPNYKIKIAKLENYDQKRQDIEKLIGQTEKLITDEERTFFKAALDDELEQLTFHLRQQLKEARHNLIETQEQIIEFLNQIKYQSNLVEKIREIKYLKDQFELRGKTNFESLLEENNSVFFEPRLSLPFKLSLETLQTDEAYDSILKANKKQSATARPSLPLADKIAEDYLQTETEEEVYLNLDELRNGFIASGKHLFEFIMGYPFEKDIPFEEKVTVFCQMISLYEDEFIITDKHAQTRQLDYALVFPK